MSKKYPKRCPWVTCVPQEDETYIVRDYYDGDEYAATKATGDLLLRMDGKTDPYTIGFSRKEVEVILKAAKERRLVRTGRLWRDSSGFGCALLTFGTPSSRSRKAAAVFNGILRLIWLPILLAGIFALNDWLAYGEITIDGLITGGVVGILAGAIFHECAHAAALAYGAVIYEAGVGVRIFPCAYLLADPDPIKKTLDRVQFSAAGIETQAVLVGIGGILCGAMPRLSGFWLGFSFANLFLGVVNLGFGKGVDGRFVIKALLGSKKMRGPHEAIQVLDHMIVSLLGQVMPLLGLLTVLLILEDIL